MVKKLKLTTINTTYNGYDGIIFTKYSNNLPHMIGISNKGIPQ